ncbi:hypothetical protein, partial [Cytobacillus oceanisediminis]|uniref:hypothetical protein n=1 Tax=Cytobacillus oceanisediminis TaxID=665099 RepID=UPI001C93115B
LLPSFYYINTLSKYIFFPFFIHSNYFFHSLIIFIPSHINHTILFFLNNINTSSLPSTFLSSSFLSAPNSR